MSNKILECKNVCKKIGKKQILKNISFELFEGDILGFIGPNGAGKTTTIKLILGLQHVDQGTIKVNGYDIEKNFIQAISEVGAIVESPDAYMYLTGRENIELVARLYKSITKERIDEVIKISGLGSWIDEKVNKYSLGMRQRLGIALAIVHKPKLLILDEPTNGLDPEGIKDIRELFAKIVKEEKMGILISSHNLLELETICNKVCIIQNGEIVETNEIEKLKEKSSNSMFFIEVNNIKDIKNLLDYEIEIVNETMFKIKITRDEVPEVVKKLVDNNYLIYKVFQSQVSLESAFLQKTGGNKIG